MSWSQKSSSEVIRELRSDLKKGLDTKQVQERISEFGQNVLPEKPRESWASVFFRQFKSPLIYILLVASVIIFFVAKDKLDALVVSGVLLFNAIVGTVQEGKARSILDGLKQFITATSVVLRDGKRLFIEDKDLVVGDIVLLQEGERVPADVRIIESNDLQIDEAILTGESRPIHKLSETIEQPVPIYEQNNMAFKGTYILSGSGVAIVVQTGADTQIGHIQREAEAIDTQMPIKKEVIRLSYFILWFVLGICLFLFALGLFTGKPVKELLITLTALFICVIPEGLPVVLTLVLVTGVYVLARKHVLVKRMQGVEALGRADAIIIDKTGTLTRNEMLVSKVATTENNYDVSGVGYFSQGEVLIAGNVVDIAQHKQLEKLGIASALLNSSELQFFPETNLFEIKGSPTEIAMMIFAQKLGFKEDRLLNEYERLFEIPFDARLQYHALFCKKDGLGIVFVSGTPEKIIQLSGNDDEALKKQLADFLQKGLRVVAVATKEFDLNAVPEGQENGKEWFESFVHSGLDFVGFCGIQDAIRPEVVETVAQARSAGIRVIMATGDHKKTALFVARKVGIFENGDRIVEGQELERLSDEQFERVLHEATVYARVTPSQKLKIVNGLRAQKNIVAMTGDGVNDVPSLAAADLGIAMGRIGTEAAKQAADIVLLDDSFVSIMKGVEYGRHIFYTLRRVILYFFSTNMGEVLVVLFALLLGMPLPITAVQILWLNLVTDGFLDMAIAAERKEKGLLTKTARFGLLRLVDWQMVGKMLFMATPMAIFSLLIFWHYYPGNLVHARSVTLVAMAMFQWFNAFNCRSETKSIFQLGLFSNRWLLLAMTVVLGLQIFVLHNSFMQRLFKTEPIGPYEWIIVICASSSILVLEELRKWFVRTKK